jgi:hypothetical protein
MKGMATMINRFDIILQKNFQEALQKGVDEWNDEDRAFISKSSSKEESAPKDEGTADDEEFNVLLQPCLPD